MNRAVRQSRNQPRLSTLQVDGSVEPVSTEKKAPRREPCAQSRDGAGRLCRRHIVAWCFLPFESQKNPWPFLSRFLPLSSARCVGRTLSWTQHTAGTVKLQLARRRFAAAYVRRRVHASPRFARLGAHGVWHSEAFSRHRWCNCGGERRSRRRRPGPASWAGG